MQTHFRSMAPVVDLFDPHEDHAKAIWCDLERQARPDYFLTWGWISNWLTHVPRRHSPQLAVIRNDGVISGAFFLGRCALRRHRLFSTQAAFVNVTGQPRYDELCLERNRILSPSAFSLRQLVEALPGNWDELYLPSIQPSAFSDLSVPSGFRLRVDGQRPSPFVDLAMVRAAGDYLALLSANSRSQIRRAQKRVGNCVLDVATSVDESLDIYEELVALHNARWQARGQPGVFADPWFDAFHRRLISQRFGHGEIQLLRLRNGGGTLGCLYNLVANGRVLFYQSGFAASADPVVKPGLLCHAAAITHAARAGLHRYDFLAGTARYKSSLATGATPLQWLRVQRASWRFALEDHARSLKRVVFAPPASHNSGGAPPPPMRLRVQVLEHAGELAAFVHEWKALAERAAEPNVFYEPCVLRPALTAFGGGCRLALVLIFGVSADPVTVAETETLLGFFPLERRPRGHDLPLPCLRPWLHDYSYVPVPLVDRAHGAAVMATFFDWLGGQRHAPPLLVMNKLPVGGPFHQLLVDEIGRRQAMTVVRARSARALLAPDGDAETYFARAISGKHRRELRRHRKRLAETGRMEISALGPRDRADDWFTEFLTVEQSGWKGKAGTALGNQERDARFFREMAAACHADGKLAMTALRLDGRALAMQTVLRAGRGAYGFKLGYDETFARYSPGVLLVMDLIERVASGWPASWIDSCAIDDHPLLGRLWTERRSLESWVISAGAGTDLLLAAWPAAAWAKRACRHTLAGRRVRTTAA